MIPRSLFVALVALAIATPILPSQAPRRATPRRVGCRFAARDSAWTARALDGWKRQASRVLGGALRRYPTLVLFDHTCSHTLVPIPGREGRSGFVSGDQTFVVHSTRHGAEVALPDGQRIPS